MPQPKKLLFRLSQPPYGNAYAREAIDAALAAAAFEQEVSLLFCGDGVYQLLPKQQPKLIDQKHFTAAFGLFSLYGIDHIYAEAESLSARNLAPEQLAIKVTSVNQQSLRALLLQQDQIISF